MSDDLADLSRQRLLEAGIRRMGGEPPPPWRRSIDGRRLIFDRTTSEHLAFLEAHHAALVRRQVRNAERQVIAGRGLDRFTPGRFPLSRLVEATDASASARLELARGRVELEPDREWQAQNARPSGATAARDPSRG